MNNQRKPSANEISILRKNSVSAFHKDSAGVGLMFQRNLIPTPTTTNTLAPAPVVAPGPSTGRSGRETVFTPTIQEIKPIVAPVATPTIRPVLPLVINKMPLVVPTPILPIEPVAPIPVVTPTPDYSTGRRPATTTVNSRETVVPITKPEVKTVVPATTTTPTTSTQSTGRPADATRPVPTTAPVTSTPRTENPTGGGQGTRSSRYATETPTTSDPVKAYTAPSDATTPGANTAVTEAKTLNIPKNYLLIGAAAIAAILLMKR